MNGIKIDLLKAVTELIGKPYHSNNKIEYGFGFWQTETITECKPFQGNDCVEVRLSVLGTDGKKHDSCSYVTQNKLQYIKENLLYSQFAGKKVTIGEDTFYSNEYYSFDGLSYGYVYKNEQAFYENPDEVCYIPEYAFSDAEKIEHNGETYYLVNGYTRKDLEALIDGEVDEDNEPINIEYFFQKLEWAYPETYLNEMVG